MKTENNTAKLVALKSLSSMIKNIAHVAANTKYKAADAAIAHTFVDLFS